MADVAAKGGAGLLVLAYGGSLFTALSHIYPEHPWKFSFFQRRSAIQLVDNIRLPASKTQYKLYEAVKMLFPSAGIRQDYRSRDLVFPSGKQMELDIFLPALKLALEYQGQPHFGVNQIYGSARD